MAFKFNKMHKYFALSARIVPFAVPRRGGAAGAAGKGPRRAFRGQAPHACPNAVFRAGFRGRLPRFAAADLSVV